MPTLQADNILDLVASTQKNLGRGKWTDIASNLIEHVAFNRLIRKDKGTFESGTGLRWNLQLSSATGAEMTGLFEVEEDDVQDTMGTAEIPWRHFRTGWLIEDREVEMNRESPEKIFDLVRSRKAAKMIGLAEFLETKFWSQPISSSDTDNMMGIFYWVVPDRTEGFNGLNPFGFTAGAGGLSSLTYPNWANYTASYSAITKTDLVRALRRAAVMTNFKSPPAANVPQYADRIKRGLYAPYAVIAQMEELLEQQNDNLGNDIASKDGDVMFRRTPIEHVPQFDTLMPTTAFVDATYASSGGYPSSAIVGIDWSTLRPVFLKGEFLREIGPFRLPHQPRTMKTGLYTTMNIECRDRRKQFVITF